MSLQAKILRALEEKKFERVGGTALLSVDVPAGGGDQQGPARPRAARRFREDLYFRLSVFPITIPPLRDRPGDIPVLARYFVERFCRDLKKRRSPCRRRRSSSCSRTAGPGNVRELQNCIERAVILADGRDAAAAASQSVLCRAAPTRTGRRRGRTSTCRARWPRSRAA
jgi:transcriptional regulator with GAF, ATPase, and Fis domain